MPHRFDREKFKQVILELCRLAPSGALGRVKLHKALYLSDMLWFIRTGEPLTGATYQKQPFGPKARNVVACLREMQRDNLLIVTQEDYFGLRTFRCEAPATQPGNALSVDERRLIGEVVDFVCGRSTLDISDLSLNAAWQAFAMGEDMLYESAYWLIPTEITDDDVAWGESEAKRLFAA